MIHLSDLSVKFQLKVQRVLSFKMVIHPNCHATAELTGTLQSAESLMEYERVHEATPVVVLADQTVLFAGVAANLKIMHENGVYNFWMLCKSSTIELDKIRSYKSDQDIQITYCDMIQSRVQQYAGCCYVNYADSLEGAISAPVYQYDETDWEFAIRVASCGGAVLYPYPYRTEPYFQSAFEKDSSNVHHLEETFCNIINNSDGLGFEVINEYAYRVGEKVHIHDRHLWITGIDVWTEHESLVFKYKIGQVPKSKLQWNQRIIGALLKGTVIGRENNFIKLHLDIDDKQPENAAFFYEYKPLTVSGLYAIPEKGTQAMLYFPDQKVNSEYAVENLHERTDGDPPEKEFKTIDNEFLLLYPGVITFTNGDGTFNATLSSSSIQIDTDGDLNVESKKSIRLEAGRQIEIKAGEDLHIRKADGKKGNIRLNDEVNISGEKFLINSVPCALTPIPDKTPEPDGVDFNQVDAAKAITGSTPRMVNANSAASSGISPVAMATGTLTSACSPSTMSAKTFSLTNNPRVQTKPVVKVLEVTQIPENIHVLFFKKGDFDAHAAQTRINCSDNISTVNDVVGAAIKLDTDLADETWTPYVAAPAQTNIIELYLPFVFERRREGTIRGQNCIVGTGEQQDSALKVKEHNAHIISCVRLAYMVYFNQDFVAAKDTTGYLYKTLQEMFQNDFADTISMSRLNPSASQAMMRFNDVMGCCNYGMWGKWYDKINGWHRGIDMCYGKNSAVNIHAISDGYLIHQGTYYFNIYMPDKDFTITYMHLTPDSRIGRDTRLLTKANGDTELLPFIQKGQVIGTESDRAANGVIHTHIEINNGLFRETAIKRPWADGNAGYKEPANAAISKITGPAIGNIHEGDTSENGFSKNPYLVSCVI